MRKKAKEVVVDDATLDEFERILNKLRDHARERENKDEDEMWFFPITKEMARFLEKAFEIRRGVKRCKKRKK